MAWRRQIATISSRWFQQVCSKSTMPTSGRDRLSRIAATFVRARSVSPWNTGLGNRQA